MNTSRIRTTRKEGNKKPDERLREVLRRRLVEMIQRNEEMRREKPR